MHLGRLTAVVDNDVVAGTPCTVIGWPMAGPVAKPRPARRFMTGMALFVARRTVWIDIGKQVNKRIKLRPFQ